MHFKKRIKNVSECLVFTCLVFLNKQMLVSIGLSVSCVGSAFSHFSPPGFVCLCVSEARLHEHLAVSAWARLKCSSRFGS